MDGLRKATAHYSKKQATVLSFVFDFRMYFDSLDEYKTMTIEMEKLYYLLLKNDSLPMKGADEQFWFNLFCSFLEIFF